MTYDLSIVNGTTLGDRRGEYTFINKNGKSTIDLCAVSGKWRELITDMKVGSEIFSDHMPIEVELTMIKKAKITNERANGRLYWQKHNEVTNKNSIIQKIENSDIEIVSLEGRLKFCKYIIKSTYIQGARKVL